MLIKTYIKLLSVFIILISGEIYTSAQSSKDLIITKGDSIDLEYPVYRGELYFETSLDMTSWIRTPMDVNTLVKPDSSCFYRLVILEGSCEPLVSDTFYIMVVHKPYVLSVNMDTITQISAYIHATLLDSGELSIVRKGACWDETSNPDVSDSVCENETAESGFWCKITGLNPGTSYYIRAFAENDSGVGYGNELVFSTLSDVNLPVVKINLIDYMSPDAVNIEGEVVSDGGVTVFDRGFCLDTLTNPDINGNMVYHASGSGISVFSKFITGLTPNTTYYVRAFAINNAGVSYSEDTSFITEPIKTIPTLSTIAIDSATCTELFVSYEVTDNGFDTVLSRGVCWSTTPNPTILNSKTNDGGGLGSFVSYIGGLNDLTTYSIRAYATNNIGTAYGNQFSITTEICKFPPSVMIVGVNDVTSESGIVECWVVNDGNDPVVERGLCWDTLNDPGLNNNVVLAGNDTGHFDVVLSGLEPFTKYYSKAYAINGIDTSFSSEFIFTTFNVKDSIVDERDGQVYDIVQICDNWWMAENLNFRTPIGSYYYDGDSLTYSGFGRLYTWYAANAIIATTPTCPAGWHLPSDDEWKELEMCLGMTQVEADKLGYRGTDEGTQLKWNGISGFNALLGGRRTSGGVYLNVDVFGYYWANDDSPGSVSYYRAFSISEPRVGRDIYAKSGAFYIRCIKD
ncbi:MAG: hypothetical protein JXB49_09195 [Bacteroidales bacterium]|nr:hypothetical protein [Bacteroidales bacterium]